MTERALALAARAIHTDLSGFMPRLLEAQNLMQMSQVFVVPEMSSFVGLGRSPAGVMNQKLVE
jgi:hypothetical protein